MILKLIKSWLRARIVEKDPKSGKETCHPNDRGTPQGGVISPLLANLYLDGLDKAVNLGKKFQSKMVRYADDFVILCHKGAAEPVMESLKQWLERRGLKLNEKKTRIIDYEKEPLNFLGFRIQRRENPKTGRSYLTVSPVLEAVGKSERRFERKQAGISSGRKRKKSLKSLINGSKDGLTTSITPTARRSSQSCSGK